MTCVTRRGSQIAVIGLDRGAGVAASQPVGQFPQPGLGVGQGLVEAAGLRGVQGVRMGEDRAAGHAQRGRRGVEEGEAGEPGRVGFPVAGPRDPHEVGVVAGGQRPDEADS
jgi:hypothetical protein